MALSGTQVHLWECQIQSWRLNPRNSPAWSRQLQLGTQFLTFINCSSVSIWEFLLKPNEQQDISKQLHGTQGSNSCKALAIRLMEFPFLHHKVSVLLFLQGRWLLILPLAHDPADISTKESWEKKANLDAGKNREAQHEASVKHSASLQPLAAEKLPEPRMAPLCWMNAAALLSMSLCNLWSQVSFQNPENPMAKSSTLHTGEEHLHSPALNPPCPGLAPFPLLRNSRDSSAPSHSCSIAASVPGHCWHKTLAHLSFCCLFRGRKFRLICDSSPANYWSCLWPFLETFFTISSVLFVRVTKRKAVLKGQTQPRLTAQRIHFLLLYQSLYLH